MYHAYSPAFEGLHVDGRTQKEAMENFKEGFEAYFLSMLKHDDPIPAGVVIHDSAAVRRCRWEEIRVPMSMGAFAAA